MKYAFIFAHEPLYSVRRMCQLLEVHPSGYYAWKKNPIDQRSLIDEELKNLINQIWLENGGTFGYRRMTDALKALGYKYSKHKVARLMRQIGLKAPSGAPSAK